MLGLVELLPEGLVVTLIVGWMVLGLILKPSSSFSSQPNRFSNKTKKVKMNPSYPEVYLYLDIHINAVVCLPPPGPRLDLDWSNEEDNG